MGARRWWILVALMAAVLPLVVDLGFALAAVRTLPGGALAAAVLPAGVAGLLPLTQRLDRLRPTLLVGLAVCLLGTVAEALADDAAAVVPARAVVAIGSAAALPAAMRTLQTVFEPAEQLRALSIWAGFSGLLLALSPLLGGLLVDAHGWPWAFAVEVPFYAVGLAALAYLLPAARAEKSSSSSASDLVAPATIVLLVVSCVVAERQLDGSRARVGVLLLVAFAAFSTVARGVAPLIRRWGSTAAAGVGAALVLSCAVAMALSAMSLLIIPLAVGGAVVLGTAPPSSPILRMLGLAAGLALAAAEPRTALLVGSTVLVGAGLLRRGGRRSGHLSPP